MKLHVLDPQTHCQSPLKHYSVKVNNIFTHYKKFQLLCNLPLLKVRNITPLQQEINK